MASLTINTDYLESLLLKIRAVHGREGVAVAEPGSNPTDDSAGIALEARSAHLDDEEIRKEIDGLNQRQQAELVALALIGRGAAEAEEWEATVERAMSDPATDAANTALTQPLAAEHIAEGMTRLTQASA